MKEQIIVSSFSLGDSWAPSLLFGDIHAVEYLRPDPTNLFQTRIRTVRNYQKRKQQGSWSRKTTILSNPVIDWLLWFITIGPHCSSHGSWNLGFSNFFPSSLPLYWSMLASKQVSVFPLSTVECEFVCVCVCINFQEALFQSYFIYGITYNQDTLFKMQ